MRVARRPVDRLSGNPGLVDRRNQLGVPGQRGADPAELGVEARQRDHRDGGHRLEPFGAPPADNRLPPPTDERMRPPAPLLAPAADLVEGLRAGSRQHDAASASGVGVCRPPGRYRWRRR